MGMKNYLTMSLFRDTGRYASGVVYCEVFLIEDGGRLDIDHYNGLYILMEKVKRHDDRVSVNKHKEEDLSGIVEDANILLKFVNLDTNDQYLFCFHSCLMHTHIWLLMV